MAQTFTNWEVIIVNDAFTNNSIEVINQVIGEDNRFKVFINKENKGCGFTKNKCAYLAQGEVLGFLDPDDALKSNALTIIYEAHCLHNETAIITSKYDLVDLEMNFLEVCNGFSLIANKSYLTYVKGAFTAFATFLIFFFQNYWY